MGACQHQLGTTQARVCSDAGILETRGDEAAQQMLDMTDGIGAIGARHGVHVSIETVIFTNIDLRAPCSRSTWLAVRS